MFHVKHYQTNIGFDLFQVNSALLIAGLFDLKA